MAGSFQRIKEKMEQFFFGGDGETDNGSSAAEKRGSYSSPSTAQDKQLNKQSESQVKVVHHYPKERAGRAEDKRQAGHVQKRIEKDNSRSAPVDTEENEEKHKTSSYVKQEERNQNYFQGNDFAPENIPSPIFGFERVPLHSDYLKKSNHTVLPETDEKTRNTMENTTDFQTPARANTVSAENESENEKPGDAPATYELKNDNEIDNGRIESDEIAASAVVEEEDTKETQPEEKISRQERRRKKREQSRGETTTSPEDGATEQKVPFNVLMYAGKESSAKSKKPETVVAEGGYRYPSIQLLKLPPKMEEEEEEDLSYQKEQLENTLQDFNVDASVVDITKGPSVTRYEVQPAAGVKVNKITNLTDDMKLALAAKDLRMEAPIPGKNAIGIEVPNTRSKPVFLREILRRDVFLRHESPLAAAMGLDISGNPVVSDLQNMPHGLIAGATGSGKSVCINSILLSLLYKADPEEVKLMLIDPKMVELASYKDIPHLVTPVINDAKEATAGLKWAVTEMNNRYEKLAAAGVRDIKKYNEKMEQTNEDSRKMPYIVIVIDELADLMMVSPQDVEDAVCRIAQKARACGIHLLLATQRPSVDVITGLIKANIPSRTAFAVSSQADSRTILDMGGAERLIGKGDMLFHQSGTSKPLRVQGTFVTDEEIDAVTDFVKKQKAPAYMFEREELVKKAEQQDSSDDLFAEACQFVSEQDGASSSLLQRRFSIGYNRAAKLIDMMEERGIISEARGSKPRRVLLTWEEIEEQILA